MAEIDELIRNFGDAIDTGRSAVFVGAGLSMPAGFPDWAQLVNPILRRAKIPPNLTRDYPLAVEYAIANFMRHKVDLHQYLLDSLATHTRTRLSGRRPAPTYTHRTLVKLPFQAWWTTNYDTLLEEAGDFQVVTQHDIYRAATKHRALIKMHGTLEHGRWEWRKDPIIARRDYESYDTTFPQAWNLLRGQFL